MNLAEYKGVFVFAQQVDNKISGIAFELIGKGKDLAKDLNTEVTAVLVGSGVKELADQLAEYGADRVIVVDDPELKEYRTEPYTHALASVVEKYKPEIFLIGATAIGRDLGPRVCARIHKMCIRDRREDDPLVRLRHRRRTQPHRGAPSVAPVSGAADGDQPVRDGRRPVLRRLQLLLHHLHQADHLGHGHHDAVHGAHLLSLIHI